MKKRIHILIGHYGTGKTTISLNFALNWAKETGKEVFLADLDVNNPYFRSRDWQAKLSENNVRLVIPEKYAFAEMPVLPKEIYSTISNKDNDLIIDLGGHSAGTKVLGSLADRISEFPYELWMVVNTYRPEMETKDEIVAMYHRLKSDSNLNITGLINNTNLANLTELEDIVRGEETVLEVADAVKVPIVVNTIEQSLVEKARKFLKQEIISIKRFDSLNW